MKKNHRVPISIAGVLVATVLLGLLRPALPARAAGSVNLPRTTVPQGAAVAVSGSGFSASDTVVICVDAPVSGHGQRIQTSIVSSSGGSFSTNLNLPRSIDPGTYTLTVKDTHGATATQHLTVLPLITLRVNDGTPVVSVLDRHAFFVDALGFQSGESVRFQAAFPAYSGNTIVETRTATADRTGNVYSVSMYAPAGAKAGQATLIATGQSSNRQASGHISVIYQPFLVLNPASITAGSAVAVTGHGFVSNTGVQVQINVQNLSATTTADNNGDFTRWITIPAYTSSGTYTVTATDLTSGIKAYAKLSVSQRPAPKPTAIPTPTPTPKPTPTPTFHASVKVLPSVTLPNQIVTLTGQGFPANTSVTVRVTIDLRGGGNRYISKFAVTDSNGSFLMTFRVPYKAAPGIYTVTASTSRAEAGDRLQVLPLSAHPKNLAFRWISLWYHTVRQGTWDYVILQSTLHTPLGIWVHVIFPNGQHWDFYTNTGRRGRWAVRFSIPRHAANKRSNQAYLTFQLWHGKQTTQFFMAFTLV